MRTCVRVCEWGTRAHTGAKVATQPYVDSVVGLSCLFVDLSVCLFIYTGGGIFALSQRRRQSYQYAIGNLIGLTSKLSGSKRRRGSAGAL